MNRHERRKLKKQNKINSNVNKDLVEGIKFHSTKDYDNAQKLYEKALASDARNYDALRHMGILYQDQKEFKKAYDYFLEAVKINPNGFEALNNLGTIHIQNKNYELALKCFNQSLRLNSDYIPTINNLAGSYHRLNEPKKALDFATKAFLMQPQNPLTKNQYAKALVINNKPEEAIKILKEISEAYPESDDFKFNLSSAYREIGNFKEANEIAKKGFEENFKKIHYLLSYTADKKNKLKDKHINYYNSLLSTEETSSEDKVVISHSLFAYFKNLQDYKKAGGYLVEGNKQQYLAREFDLDKEKIFFDRIKNIFSKKKILRIDTNIKNKIPIFICGMPRSGTTLCEQILSSHTKIEGAGELNYLAEESGIIKLIHPSKEQIDKIEECTNNSDQLFSARKNYISRLSVHGKDKTRYICDKMPHNFILIGFIKLILPEAKIIYCKRDPIDNCFSLYSHKFLELSHQYSYDQKVLAQYYKMHQDLMNFWLKKYNDSIYVLDNEKLVNNQEDVSKELVQFCNVDWEEDCLNFYKLKRQVRTASIEQVRTPINKKSIGAWKNYKNYLSELVSGLGN